MKPIGELLTIIFGGIAVGVVFIAAVAMLTTGCSTAAPWSYSPLRGQTQEQFQADYIACQTEPAPACMESRGYSAARHAPATAEDTAGFLDVLSNLMDIIGGAAQ